MKNLKDIYPLPDKVYARATTTLGEVRQPYMPSVLLELGYHDNTADALWVENSIQAIAANLVQSLTTYFGLPFITPLTPWQGTVRTPQGGSLNLRAAPGTRDAGAISYAVAYYAEPKLLFSVQPGSFYPAPKVTSAVIRLDVRKTPAVQVPNGDEAAFFALIRAAFSQRRKTAANAIANGLHLPKAQVLTALQSAGLDERARPEQLTLEEYCALQNALHTK